MMQMQTSDGVIVSEIYHVKHKIMYKCGVQVGELCVLTYIGSSIGSRAAIYSNKKPTQNSY